MTDAAQVQVEVEYDDLFAIARRQFVDQAREGLEKHAQAVVDSARDSMPWAPGAPKGAPAAEGAPPNRQTGALGEALTWAVSGDGFIAAGVDGSEVGLQGTVLEYGGRPRSKKRKTRRTGKAYKQHPFIGPAFDREMDNFAPRVAGTLTS